MLSWGRRVQASRYRRGLSELISTPSRTNEIIAASTGPLVDAPLRLNDAYAGPISPIQNSMMHSPTDRPGVVGQLWLGNPA